MTPPPFLAVPAPTAPRPAPTATSPRCATRPRDHDPSGEETRDHGPALLPVSGRLFSRTRGDPVEKRDAESVSRSRCFFLHLLWPQPRGLLREDEREEEEAWAGHQLAEVLLPPGSLEER